MLRTSIGFLLAPALGVLVPLAPLWGWPINPLSLLFLIPAYIAAFVLGVPMFIFLRDSKLLNLTTLVIGGYLIAAATLLLIFTMMAGLNFKIALGIPLNPFNLMGICGGLMFWVIAVYGRKTL